MSIVLLPAREIVSKRNPDTSGTPFSPSIAHLDCCDPIERLQCGRLHFEKRRELQGEDLERKRPAPPLPNGDGSAKAPTPPVPFSPPVSPTGEHAKDANADGSLSNPSIPTATVRATQSGAIHRRVG